MLGGGRGLGRGGDEVMNCKGDYNCWIFKWNQRFYWGMLFGYHWGDYHEQLLCGCETVPMYLSLDLFFWWYRICMLFSMVPKECACSFTCFANGEEWLLFRKARLRSLYLLIKCLPICPMYALLQSRQFSLYILWIRICHGCSYCMLGGCKWYCLCDRLFLYLSVRIYWWRM